MGLIVVTSIGSLPDHCYECPCHDGESGYCQADKEQRYSYNRPYWCPLKEIEVGMIDREKEKVYKKFIRPMMLSPASAQDYTAKRIPIEAEEKWYHENARETLIKKYKHFETIFDTLVFDEKYEELTVSE